MAGFTDRVLRHRWLVIAAWVVVAAVGGALAPTAINRLSYDFGLPGQPAYEANRDIRERFGNGGQADPLVVTVTVPEGRTLDDPAVRGELGAAFGRLNQPGWRVVSPLDTGFGEPLVSGDRRTAVALVYPNVTPGPVTYAEAEPRLTGTLADARVAGAPLLVTGVAPLNESGGGSDRPIIVEILLGAGGALVILVLAFGSVLALVPLALAAVAITTTFLLVLALSAGLDVSFIVQYLVGLIGLGVAIDYALLVITRWREERAAGADNDTAVRTAMATAGRAVVFSGVTVAISLLVLVVLPLPFLRSVGIGGMLIPLVSVLVALTLLPAVLAVAGDRLEWPRKRPPETDSRFWHRIGTFVVRRRFVAAVLATAALVLMALPVFGIRLGSPELAALAGGDSPAARGYAAVADGGIAPGVMRPIEVLTDDPSAVTSAVRDLPGVAATVAPDTVAWTAVSGGRVMLVVLSVDPATEAGEAAVARVRAAVADVGRVGGTAAEDADSVDAIYGDAWWLLLLIVVVTFLLLARALRSVWLPIKALLLNVVSIGAAYGLAVLIWQEGYGSKAIFDTETAGTITVWVPIAAFSFLFGLSMDYEVFILARIREGHDQGMSTDDATVYGLRHTGRLVTSAALILFCAFVALSTVPVVDVKIFATTLGLGIALDATIVRGVLTPALVAAFGRVNWWYPFHRRSPEPAPQR
jgi:putative drug exporter of the RND superfamily